MRRGGTKFRVEALNDRCAQELAADLIALDIVMRTDRDAFGQVMTFAACELVFIFRGLLERFNPSGPAPSRTHPSWSFRLANLRAAIRTDPNASDALFEPGRVFEQLAANLSFRVRRRRAERGDFDNQYVVAKCYDEGHGVSRDARKALQWYRMAAEGGHADAQLSLGVKLWGGKGLPKDRVEAVKWYRRSAAQGNRAAQHNLASALLNGDGVENNDGAAVDLFKQAAAAGVPYSQADLAYCMIHGLGIDRDLVGALAWLLIAHRSGLLDMSEQIKKLEADLSKVQLTEARRRAAEWTY